MKKGMFYALAAILVGMLLQGCGAFQTQPRQVELYTLAYPAPDAAEADTTLPVRLAVKPFRAVAPYHSDRMVYADNDYRRSTYVYHKWLAKPAEMIGSLIIRDIRAAQLVETAGEDTGNDPTHILKCRVEAFYEDDSRDPWTAVLALSVSLSKKAPAASDSPVLLQKTYRVRRDLEHNNPLGFAKAMSRALETVSERMVADIHDHLAR
ncbi:MAG: membrane integrity-associated transporter subunit PqiC [Desulfobacterales bacterium]|nr:membrane integrity-associated transporter subunit PqiC [Desulfobacterales bacterium]MBS3756366.1 membrane integrity-associated transporter subunit PqiC [Desulfobacterales bacterium]